MHDFGNHRQGVDRPGTDTWNEQQLGEIDRARSAAAAKSRKARRDHITCADLVMGRHDQMWQMAALTGMAGVAFNPARQSHEIARDPVRPQGFQDVKLSTARAQHGDR